MFPPPRKWKQVGTVDPEREYVAFTSRFHLKSPLRVPAFLRQSSQIEKQVDAAPGIVGWSLGANLLTLEFYTLSAWENAESLRTFTASSVHGQALSKFAGDMRTDSIFVQFTVSGSELPLTWADAIALQKTHLAAAGRSR
jgi:hypothetical protein